MSLFVSINGDIYIDNGANNRRVDRWNYNTSTITSIMFINGSCSSLFMDASNYLYCSMTNYHQIVRKSITDLTNTTAVVAGTGTPGFSSNMLNSPEGIYIDSNSNMYVADCGNDRVQLFLSIQPTGTTVIGNGSSESISLRCPSSVALDSNGYLFIVDRSNHRIIGSGPYGFRCIIGCSGSSGSSPSQLLFPRTMSFDSYGNILVADQNNRRIQKFILQNTQCGQYLFSRMRIDI